MMMWFAVIISLTYLMNRLGTWADHIGECLAAPIKRRRKATRQRTVEQMRRRFPGYYTDREIERRIFGNNLD
jgi:hypothetical protein